MVSVTVSITAKNPSDPYERIWSVYFDRPPGAYPFTDGDIVEDLASGGTLTGSKDLSAGSHTLYFIISSPPNLGTYSGTIQIDGQSFQFSNVSDANATSAQFTVGGAGGGGGAGGFNLNMLLQPPYVYYLVGGIAVVGLAIYLSRH